MDSSSSSSRTKSNNDSRVYFKRSISPSGRFSNLISQSSSGFLTTRPTSPTRVNLRGSVVSSSSIRFPTTFSNHKQKHNNNNKEWSSSSSSIRGQKKTCMCSPTTHPGSFRCSLHKGVASDQRRHQTVSYHSHRLDARRSAMTNSLVRIGTVEGDLVKRALAALIRPSSHQQKRRADFQPCPTRFSIMSKARGEAT